MKLIQKYPFPLTISFSREFRGILIVLTAFLIFPYLIRQLDITAAAIDPGIISAILLAAGAVFVFKALTWWLIKSIWPIFSSYSEGQFGSNFRSMACTHKVITYLTFYMLIFYAFVIIMASLI